MIILYGCGGFLRRGTFGLSVKSERGQRFRRIDLSQGRKFVQGLQPKIVQKLMGRAQQSGPARGIAMPQDLDPATLLKGAHNLRGYRHAANIFDIAARDRLTPGNDGQGFKNGSRILGGPYGGETTQVPLHFGPTLEAPPCRDADELQPSVLPVQLKQRQQAPQIVRSDFFCCEKLAQFGQGHGLIRT